MQTLGITVRTVGAADVRPLVPIEPEPSKVVQHRRLRFARRALDVRVLDPQDERPAVTAREQPVEDGRPHVADVKRTCWTGCEANSHDRGADLKACTTCS